MEFRFGSSVIYMTKNRDADGRIILTKIPPSGRASVRVGRKTYTPLREAAKRLGLHEQHLREKVWNGYVPSGKINGRVYVEEKWVKEIEMLL